MNYQTLVNTIRKRFKAQIETIQSVAVRYDNDPRGLPENQIWINLVILPGATQQVSLGKTKTFRTVGVMVAQIFAPVNMTNCEKSVNQLADAVVSSFRSVTAAGVVYKTPTILRIGRQSQYWQLNVDCPFQHDHIA